MVDKVNNLFSFLDALNRNISNMISKENAKNLKTFLDCLKMISPMLAFVYPIFTSEVNQLDQVSEQIERGFEEVNNNLKTLENELKMELESSKVFTAMSHIKTGYYDVIQMEASENPITWYQFLTFNL